MAVMIETESLRFAYPADEGEKPVYALRGVDLTIEKGSFVVILGHNGSGKSTLAKTFNAVLLPAGGTVWVDGMDTKDEALLLETAALAESYSNHPIARSLRDAYGKEIDESRIGNVAEIAGRGVKADVDGQRALQENIWPAGAV